MKILFLALIGLLPLTLQAQFLSQPNADGTLTVTIYTGAATNDIIIPAAIGDVQVTGIGPGLFSDATGLVSVSIPECVTSIGDQAFANCISLTNVNIPANVTCIGQYAFAGDTGLTSVTISGNGSRIGEFAFESRSGLTNVILGDGVASIGLLGFCYCSGLRSVTIGNSVSNIGNSAFEYCSQLTNVTIGSSVTSIGVDVFGECFDLSEITIPESVTTIGRSAFSNDIGLRHVTIPKGVFEIDDYAFSECTNLTGVYFRGDAPAVIGSDVFLEDGNATAYYLPNTTGWSATFGDLPTVLWDPKLEACASHLGIGSNQFGVKITGTTDIPIVAETSTNLNDPAWTLLLTGTLTNGSIYIGDSQWTNFPNRFYRVSSP